MDTQSDETPGPSASPGVERLTVMKKTALKFACCILDLATLMSPVRMRWL